VTEDDGPRAVETPYGFNMVDSEGNTIVEVWRASAMKDMSWEGEPDAAEPESTEAKQ
jgi:hypothetical protein